MPKPILNECYYRLNKEHLCDCIRHCEMKGGGDWWYLPDIQRSFVWQAKSTLMLIDSLLRGWPFGTLTLQRASAQDCVSIAPRAFLKESGCVCDWGWRCTTFGQRVTLDQDRDVEMDNFYLVLDGQQRLQSMLFAFADAQTGYRMNEWEWMQDLWGWNLRKKRNEDYKECPLAGIYLDVNKLIVGLADSSRIDQVKYFDSGIICYAIPDRDFDSEYYYRDSEWPFPVRKKDSGLVKLSRLWSFIRVELAEMPTDKISLEFVLEKLQRYWDSPGWNLDPTILELNGADVAKFVVYLYQSIYMMEVGRIELEKPRDVVEESFQHDVVEIFTRLNHGGKPLEVSEITGAWLKNYWDKKAERKGAERVICDLMNTCREKGIELPDFMRFASALWAVAGDAGTERKVIQNKDLTNVELLRNLAQWLSRNWKSIQRATLLVMQDLSSIKWLINSMGSTAFPFAILVSFRMKIEDASAGMNEQTRTNYLHGTIDKIRSECPRFLACSAWSDYWSVSSLTAFGKKFELVNDSNANDIFQAFASVLDEILIPKAENALSEAIAYNRSQVRTYYLYLQVWHRLNKDRYMAWMANLDSDDLHVDHCLAYAKWLDILGESRSEITVEKDQEYRVLINSIGNCMLLRSGANIGKGKKPFKEFFSYLWEDGNNPARASLEITDAMAMPSKNDIVKIRQDIHARDLNIRKELSDFIKGERLIQSW